MSSTCAVKHISNDQSRYLHHLQPGPRARLAKQYDASLADFAEGKSSIPTDPQIPAYRCITYTEMGRFDEALADCNEALAQSSENVYGRWPAGAMSISARAISTPR